MNDEVAVSAKIEATPAVAVSSQAATIRTRAVERTRRADAARIAALVQYMLHRGGDVRELH